MVHPRATGLVDDWRERTQLPYGTAQLQSTSPLSPATSTSLASVLSRNTFDVSYLVAYLNHRLTIYDTVWRGFAPNLYSPKDGKAGKSIPWDQGPSCTSSGLSQLVHSLCYPTGG